MSKACPTNCRTPSQVAADDCNTQRTKAAGRAPGLKPRRPGGHALLEERSGVLDAALAGVAERDLPFTMLHHGLPRAEQGALGTGFPMLVVEVIEDRGTDRELASMLFLVPGLQEQIHRGRRRGGAAASGVFEDAAAAC